jgi:cullin 3
MSELRPPAVSLDGHPDPTVLAAWEKIKSSISLVFSCHSGHLSFEECYRQVYTLCLQNFERELHAGLVHAVETHLRDNVTPSLVPFCVRSEVASPGDSATATPTLRLLPALTRSWAAFWQAIKTISGMCLYLDRQLSVHPALVDAKPTRLVGTTAFAEIVIGHPEIRQALSSELVAALSPSPDPTILPPPSVIQLCAAAVGMLQTLPGNAAITVFVRPLLLSLQTRVGYIAAPLDSPLKETDSTAFATGCVAPFLLSANALVISMADAAHHLGLTADAALALLQVAHDAAILDHIDLLTGPGLRGLLAAGDTVSLGHLFRLAHPVLGGFAAVCKGVRVAAEAEFAAIIKNSSSAPASPSSFAGDPEFLPARNAVSPAETIKSIVETRARLLAVVSAGFANDGSVIAAVQGALSTALSSLHAAPAALAAYIDAVVRAAPDTSPTRDELEGIVGIFRHIPAKAEVVTCLGQGLARRLLTGRGVHETADAAVVLRLRDEAGPEYVADLETMLEEIETSRTISETYGVFCAVDPPDVDMPAFDCAILSAQAWPVKPLESGKLPATLSARAQHFAAHYSDAHTGRRLEFVLDRGSAEVEARFPNGAECILSATLPAAIVLSAFADAPGGIRSHLSVSILAHVTELPLTTLRRALLALSVGRMPVLCRRGAIPLRCSASIAAEDVFWVNPSYQPPASVVVIARVVDRPQLATQAGGNGGEGRSVRDRATAIDAAVVRVMKAREKLAVDELVQEVTSSIGVFTPTHTDVKARLEHLIDSQYIERDEGNAALLVYVP